MRRTDILVTLAPLLWIYARHLYIYTYDRLYIQRFYIRIFERGTSPPPFY